MFREQYKGAYNEIKGNRALIDKVFASKVKPEKKKIIPFKYATTLVAAMVALVIVVGYPNFTEYSKPETKELTPVDITDYELPKLENTVISGSEETMQADISPAPAQISRARMVESTEYDVSAINEPVVASNTDTIVLENGKVAVRLYDFDEDAILARMKDSEYIIDEEDGKQILYVKSGEYLYSYQFYDFSEQDILELIENI